MNGKGKRVRVADRDLKIIDSVVPHGGEWTAVSKVTLTVTDGENTVDLDLISGSYLDVIE